MSRLARILIVLFGVSGPEITVRSLGDADDAITGEVEGATAFDTYYESDTSPTEDGAVLTGRAWGKFTELHSSDGLSLGAQFCGEDLFTSGDFTPNEDYYWRIDFEVTYHLDGDGDVVREASGTLILGANAMEGIVIPLYADSDTVSDCDAATVQVMVNWQVDADDADRITMASLIASETSL